MDRKTIAAVSLAALLGTGVGAVIYGMEDTRYVALDEPAGYEETAPSPTGKGHGEKDGIVVSVVGAVAAPGLIELKEGARVAEAIEQAGGLLPSADEKNVNLARVLKDGEQIYVAEVPAPSGVGSADGANVPNKGKTSATPAAASGRININTADEAALDTLPGVGPALAKRIVEYRQTEGAFTAPEDIQNVKGIGPAKYEKMKDKITT